MKPGTISRLFLVLNIAWGIMCIGCFVLIDWFMLKDQTLAEATGLGGGLILVIFLSIVFLPMLLLSFLYSVGYWIGHEEWPFTSRDIEDLGRALCFLAFIVVASFAYDLLQPLIEPLWAAIKSHWGFQNWNQWFQKIGNGIQTLTEGILAIFVAGAIFASISRVNDKLIRRKPGAHRPLK